jgi:hypothetical protein
MLFLSSFATVFAAISVIFSKKDIAVARLNFPFANQLLLII